VSTWHIDLGSGGFIETLHVVGVTKEGKLWYMKRVGQQDWQPFDDLTVRIGGDWGAFQSVGMTTYRGSLDVCTVVKTTQGEQRILHTSGTGSFWDRFEDLNELQSAGFPGSFVSVDCAYLLIGDRSLLYVCGVTQDGKLWYTPRWDFTWLPFANQQLLVKNAPQVFSNISLEGGQTLELCAQADGDLWHTSCLSTRPPSWQSFDNISAMLDRPVSFQSASCASVNGILHLCSVTDQGKIWHTSRTSSNPPQWQPFEDVTLLVGSPGNFVFVCVASSSVEPLGVQFPVITQSCDDIALQISIDVSQLQTLQMQGVNAQVQQQLTRLQREIAGLQQKARDQQCP
jgi:hypothetical protein